MPNSVEFLPCLYFGSNNIKSDKGENEILDKGLTEFIPFISSGFLIIIGIFCQIVVKVKRFTRECKLLWEIN